MVVGRYCVAFRSCPRPDTRKGAPRVAAPTEINRPRTFSGQPHIPSCGVGADQPSGIPMVSRRFAASATHCASSLGVVQKLCQLAPAQPEGSRVNGIDS